MDGCRLPEKKPAEAALHRFCGVLYQGLFQVGEVTFTLTTRGEVIGGDRCSGLDAVSFVERHELVIYERCVIVRYHPPRNAKRRKERTQLTEGRCLLRMRYLPNLESLRVRVDHGQDAAVFYWSGEVNIERVCIGPGAFV